MKLSNAFCRLGYLTASLFLAACQTAPQQAGQQPQSLTPFESEAEFQAFREKALIWQTNYRWTPYSATASSPTTPPTGVTLSDSTNGSDPPSLAIEEVVVTASMAVSAPSITNNQVSGVDEGDIVKRIGDNLVLLRRGRLFSFTLPGNGGHPEAIAFIDLGAFRESEDAWYDEMLVDERQIIVIGYEYDIGVTLIQRYLLSQTGEFVRTDVHAFASGDYFNADNYPTRLINGNLLFYIPRLLEGIDGAFQAAKFDGDQLIEDGDLFISNKIYQPLQQQAESMLHTVVTCPLHTSSLRCRAKSIVGSLDSHYYVDSNAMYLWLNAPLNQHNFMNLSDNDIEKFATAGESLEKQSGASDDDAVLYRLPFGDENPTALRVSGRPVNQFSFQSNASHMRVLAQELTQATPEGDIQTPFIWKIPLSGFGPELAPLNELYKTRLPELTGSTSVNRFVGNYLLYDDTLWNGESANATIAVLDLATDADPVKFSIEHHIHRIESLGDSAVIIGDHDNNSILAFTALQPGTRTWLGGTHHEESAEAADSRSHSFNYTWLGETALIGFPTVTPPADRNWEMTPGTDMRFYTLDNTLNWGESGTLFGNTRHEDDDWCLVSCEDWYGTARPFFIDGRIYALLDYELVSAGLFGTQVIETARADGLSLVEKAHNEGAIETPSGNL